MRKLFIFLAVILLVLVLAGAASATGPVTPAYTPAVSTDNSAIDGHKMVYEKKSTSTNKDIYVTDLSTGSSKAVSTSSYDESNPDISGNIVVWQKYDSSGSLANMVERYQQNQSRSLSTRITRKRPVIIPVFQETM